MSNGFAEAGAEGQALQAELLRKITGSGTHVLGPNALGVVDLHANVALSANEVLSLPELPKGDVGLISQSGSMLGAILSRGAARGTGFSKLVSVGNEADISVAELIEMMVEDSQTSVIPLFLESIRSPDALRAAALKVYRANKPIHAYRLGRSAVGQQLAVSYTGALTGSGRATSAFLKDIGIVEISNFDALLDAPPLFRASRATGSRIGVMSTTGGGGALVAVVGSSSQFRPERAVAPILKANATKPIAQVSSLACTGDEIQVAEAEINPLAVLAEGRGVCALDGLVVLQ